MLMLRNHFATSWQPYKSRGFTIVELLIVIVVIAVLATITTVAYNGIQSQAQQSRLASELNSVSKRVELFAVANSTYPQSVTDCPTPSLVNICLPVGSGETYSYQAFIPGGSGYTNTDNNSYQLSILGATQFVYFSNAIRHGTNEFMQYVDVAPLIDQYGLRKYQLSFDIKSVSVANKSTVQVYFQNGSTARYGGLMQTIPVTTSYVHQTITFTPTANNLSVTESMLAFYGSYSTGNVPIVTNVAIQLAP